MNKTPFPTGAEWRQWDLHVHTPASFQWSGGKRLARMTADERRSAMDAMITAMNAAAPRVFALMDYWTFDGWFALQDRLKETGAPTLEKTVFPGIELRLVSPTPYRLNAHVLFADDISPQDLHDFRTHLAVALVNQPLSDTCLVRLAQQHINPDKLEKHGFKIEEVKANPDVALRAGATTAEVTAESYSRAIEAVPNAKAIGFMPWDTHDGLADADWSAHYAFVLGLMRSSPIFETRKADLWAAFAGVETDGNNKWFSPFQAALQHIPRLAVSGSDAHSFVEYGQFPNGKATWIKADPTFLGLQQAIKEPAKRSFIGQQPDKLLEVASNKTFFVDSITIFREPAAHLTEQWLDKCDLPLNQDLIAIIGNKGSGKSALADVIALLGNSKQGRHFSFLTAKRFRAKPKELAKHFRGIIKWRDGTSSNRLLSEDSEPEAVELIKYIPQAHFEKLCNDHVSGESDVFEQELRFVIFSHADAAMRQGAHDFNQLVDQQESGFRDRLTEYRKELGRLNQEIESIENQLRPEVLRQQQEFKALKEKQLEEHDKIRPPEPVQPTEELSTEQQEASAALAALTNRLKGIDLDSEASVAATAALATKLKATHSIRDRLRLFERQYDQLKKDTAADLKLLGLGIEQVVSVKTDAKAISEIADNVAAEQASRAEGDEARSGERAAVERDIATNTTRLNAPLQQYQRELHAMEQWQAQRGALVGAPDRPDTQEGLDARIAQLGGLPEIHQRKEANRLALAREIFDVLAEQRGAREALFAPVQELISKNTLIREEYKLQFRATLAAYADALGARLFELVKQQAGELRGDEALAMVRRVAEKYDLNVADGALQFVDELYGKVRNAAAASDEYGVASVLRKGRSAAEVYDLIFGLEFLEPRYTLLFQDTQISQLSPGQRGALLLIFYLLVDRGHNPIILDQPEENLDNETVVSLLVPVLTEAKRRRQILMVTHNPNLAVVCDAEQVVRASFDRKNEARITYVSGSIESPTINRHVVNVLEGTKVAFDNRGGKYLKSSGI
jgi:ABC-type lipoprotein export system ATPase subunit